jgi:FkbM family methyltransferase
MLRKMIRDVLPYRLVKTFQERKLNAETLNLQRNLYSLFVPDNGLVFDVGANRGNRIGCFRTLNATVHAFEPQPVCAKYLREMFHYDPHVIIHESAIGATIGKAQMQVSTELDVLSTLSDAFIDKVSASGRFSRKHWDATVEVEVTTLDICISSFGKPDFIKIDVEGFEIEALTGLSTCIPSLSFEWTPELFEQAEFCIKLCSQLGICHFNMSFGESMKLSQQWCDDKQMIEKLYACRNDHYLFGDIYAKADLI